MKKINDPQPGFYKKRLWARGPWAPVRLWLEDGERDELGRLMSDQILRCEWNPNLHDPLAFYPIDPIEEWTWLWPIKEDEYEWLIVLKTL